MTGIGRFRPSGWMVLLIIGAWIALPGCTAAGGGGGGGDTPGPSHNDNIPQPPDETNVIAREIEEADIVKYDDGYLYLANRWRGLRIIDARTIERPQLVGGADAKGRAIELYVRDDHVFLIASADHFYCAGDPLTYEDEAVADDLVSPGYVGSRLTVFDVSDPANPLQVRVFPMNGYVTATRRVGDVIYVAGNELEAPEPPDDGTTNGDSDDATTNGSEPTDGDTPAPPPVLADSLFVESINIADPGNPQAIDFVRVEGIAGELHVSSKAVYVAGQDPTEEDATRIAYVDIADPGGNITVRDEFRVPGVLRNRFFMDEYGDTFRVVVQYQEMVSPIQSRQVVALYTYDVSDPDDVEYLSRLPILADEDVWAVRFDGPRGYVVTYYQIDPLFVLDLSDPENPLIAGELEVPGLSTHLVPLGERLLAIGYDETRWFRPALSLYDVSEPTVPRLSSRLIIGDLDLYGVTSEATFDEKALKVLEDEGLVLVPYSYFDEEELDWVDSLQIVDLLPDQLVERGKVDHRGLVRRAGVLDDRLWVLSDEALGVFDIDDRDNPTGLDRVDIITEQELLDAGLAHCVDSARFRENPTGITVPGGGSNVVFISGPCGAFSVSTLSMLLAGMALLRLKKWG